MSPDIHAEELPPPFSLDFNRLCAYPRRTTPGKDAEQLPAIFWGLRFSTENSVAYKAAEVASYIRDFLSYPVIDIQPLCITSRPRT